MQEEDLREDIYAFFNIKRDATPEDITNAYRRLSKIYHPDKHGDPDLKKQAEELFNKTRKFYDVLIDPQKRAIYDTIGDNLLSPEGAGGGWEVIERHMSPTEIREEYERLVKLREEQLLQQRTNPTGSVNITINACDLFRPSYNDFDDEFYEVSFPEITRMSISQSVEAPATLNDRFIVGGSLMAQNGIGSGGLSLTWRRLLGTSMWAETDFGVGDNLAISCKVFRTFSNKMYGFAQVIGQISGDGIRPGFVFGLNRMLEKHWTGSITVKLGLQQSITTSLVFEEPRNRQFVFAVVVSMPTSFAMISAKKNLSENEARVNGSVRVGTFGIITDIGYERKVSQHSSAGCSCRIHFPKGLVVKFKWTRAAQTYVINVVLCDQELMPSAFVFGVVTPILVYNVVKWCVKPYLDRKRERENAEKRSKAESGLDSKKKEAEITITLMRLTAERMRDAETEKKGLVIIEAWYGSNLSAANDSPSSSSSNVLPAKIVDVRIPLQAMVKDSKLILYESPKWQLAGFYDPCFGEEKMLRVIYKSSDVLHQVTIKDDELLVIPNYTHRVQRSEDGNGDKIDNVGINED